jgi:hypothetical protein
MSKLLKIKLTKNEIERINKKITINYNTGCWEWTGAKVKNRGYGVFNFRGKTQMVHRLMFAHYKYPIPLGMKDGVIDHIVCNNPACCNPEHLILTTQKRNALRGDSPPSINSRKTHCVRGHELPQLPTKGDGRRCVICRRINASRRYKERTTRS